MTKSARRKRREATAAKKTASTLVRAKYRLVGIKKIEWRPYEKPDGDIAFAEIGFPCCRVEICNEDTGNHTRIGYSYKHTKRRDESTGTTHVSADHAFSVHTHHGLTKRFGRSEFQTYCQERFGMPGLVDYILSFMQE